MGMGLMMSILTSVSASYCFLFIYSVSSISISILSLYQSSCNPAHQVPDSAKDLHRPSYVAGARIHTNSSGSQHQGRGSYSNADSDRWLYENTDYIVSTKTLLIRTCFICCNQHTDDAYTRLCDSVCSFYSYFHYPPLPHPALMLLCIGFVCCWEYWWAILSSQCARQL